MENKDYIKKLKELQSRIIINDAKNATNSENESVQSQGEFINNLRTLGKQAENICTHNYFTLRKSLIDLKYLLPKEEQGEYMKRISQCETLQSLTIAPSFTTNQKFKEKIGKTLISFYAEIDSYKDNTKAALESFNELFKYYEMEPEDLSKFDYKNFAKEFTEALIEDVERGLDGYKKVETYYKMDKSAISEDMSKMIDKICMNRDSYSNLSKATKDFIKDYKELSKKADFQDKMLEFCSQHIPEINNIITFAEKGIVNQGYRKGIMDLEK